MKTANFEEVTKTQNLTGVNGIYELETYVRVRMLIVNVSGSELANKENLFEHIREKLSENLQLASSHILNFETTNNMEPYQIDVDIDFTFITPNLNRIQPDLDDIKHRVLKTFQANAINFS